MKDLERQYQPQPGDPEYAKQAAKDLAWMIPAMAVEGFTLALFVADILMLALIILRRCKVLAPPTDTPMSDTPIAKHFCPVYTAPK